MHNLRDARHINCWFHFLNATSRPNIAASALPMTQTGQPFRRNLLVSARSKPTNALNASSGTPCVLEVTWQACLITLRKADRYWRALLIW